MAPSDQALKSPICPAGMSIKQHDITDKRAVLPQTTSAASSTRNKSIAFSLSYTPSSRAQHQKQDTNDSNFVSGIPRAHVLTSLPKHSQYEASSISASASGLRKRTSQTLVGKVDRAYPPPLPQYNTPPPDSDIAQLWEEVKERMAEMAQRRSKEAPLSASPVTSESSRISDKLQDYDFTVLSPGLPDGTSIPRYLDVESVTGDPQFAHALDEDLVGAYYCSRPKVLFDSINYNPLVYLLATNSSLKNTNGTQDSQVNIRRPMPPNLSLLHFSATENRSEQFRKRSFGLDIERTLAVMGNYPGTAKTIPTSIMDEARTGAIFLHFLGRNPGSSTDLLTEWKLIAYKELLMQLQIYRVDFAVEDKVKMLSSLRQFGYLIHNSKMEIWEMKVRTATPDKTQANLLSQPSSKPSSERFSIPVAKEVSESTSKVGPSQRPFSKEAASRAPNDKSSSTTATRTKQSISKPPQRLNDPTPIQTKTSNSPTKVISGSIPFVLPCTCRRICVLDLIEITDIREFYDANNAIMRWGQAKHGMQFMENIHRLLMRDGDDNNEWMMSAEETKEFWKDLVAFEGPKPDCL